MPEALTKLWKQVVEFWQGLDKSQKVRLYVTSAVVVVAVTISIILLTKPSYITIIRNADQKQVGEMVTILDDSGIAHKEESNGTSIVVNLKDNNKAQIALAQQGYPKDGMTFEDAISKIGITTTQDDKKKIWHEQQVSDLAAKVKMIEGVDDAAVTLAEPEKSIFYTDEKETPKSTAYVMVKSGNKLSQKQVEGIVMLVARSVESLDPQDVTVADGNGIILNQNTGDNAIDAANSQEEMRVKREKELVQKVLDYFSVGQFDNFDTLRVVANVSLDFDKDKSQTKTLTNPTGMDGGALISSDTKDEKVTGGTTGGVPGTDTNPGTTNSPSYQLGDSGSQNYTNKEEKKNFGYDEKVSDYEKATGKMLADKSSMAISLWYGKQVKDDTKIDDAFITQIRQAASTATGIPVNNISINKLKMATPDAVAKPLTDTIKQMIADYGLFALMLLLIIGMLIMAIPRKKRELQPQLATGDLEASLAGPKFIVPETEDPIPEIAMEERSEIKKQIEKFVKQKPDAVAQLLRNWISDEWDG